jgi:hypothetical protein
MAEPDSKPAQSGCLRTIAWVIFFVTPIPFSLFKTWQGALAGTVILAGLAGLAWILARE